MYERKIPVDLSCPLRLTMSLIDSKWKYARELFTDDAVLFGFLDGEPERGSIEQFYHNVDTVSGGEAFKARVDVVAVDLSCPLRLTMSLIDSKWKSCILDELRNVAMRHSSAVDFIPDHIF